MDNATIIINKREADMLYRACMSRSIHFQQEAAATQNDDMAKTYQGCAARYSALARDIIGPFRPTAF